MRSLIAFTGAAGAGKDTAASILCRHDDDWVQDSFAAPLYVALAAVLNTTAGHLRKRDVKDTPWPGLSVTPRRMLQTLGTDWGRDLIDRDIWLKLAADRHRVRISRFRQRTVITDVRFPNEAYWVQNQGGLLVRVMRAVDGVETHISERAMEGVPVDYTLDNTGTLDQLDERIRALWVLHLGRD